MTRHIADASGKVPEWMKLVRQDNTITGWTSYDGSRWTKVHSDVALDGGDNLYITDPGNGHILYYPAGSTMATEVYGQQGSFSTNIVNNGGISAMSLFAPLGIAIDRSGTIYTADNGNNRALMFPHI